MNESFALYFIIFLSTFLIGLTYYTFLVGFSVDNELIDPFSEAE